MKKSTVAFFIIFSVAGFLFPLQREDIRFRHISLNEGLSQSWVPCIIQDHKGFMWIGTQDGLNKYDGYSFKTYRPEGGNPAGLSGNDIASLFEDSRGVLWVGTLREGLNRFDRNKDGFTHFLPKPNDPASLSNDSVGVIYEDQAGQLWIGTNNGLNKFNRENGNFTRYRNIAGDVHSLSHNRIRAIYQDRAGTFWIGTSNGLNKFDVHTGRCVRYCWEPGIPPTSAGINKTLFTVIYEDGMGRFWLGTRNGLKRFDRETGEFTSYHSDPSNPHTLSGNRITGICEDQKGVMWVTTRRKGLNSFDRETGQFIRYRADPKVPYALSSDRILTTYKDRSGSLWMGTMDKGVNRFDRQTAKFKHYRKNPNDADSLSHDVVYPILEDREGILWIGTFGGGLNRLDRKTGRFTVYRSKPGKPGTSAQTLGVRADVRGLSHDIVNTIFEDSKSALWLGTNGGGLDKFDRKTESFRNYRNDPNDPTSISGDAIETLFEDEDGNLWVGTLGAGLNKFDRQSETFTAYLPNPDQPGSLSSDVIFDICKDRKDEVLWIATLNGGLNKFNLQTQQFTVYRHKADDPTSLSSDSIMVLYQEPSVRADTPSGILWVGTYGGGLNKFDPEKEVSIHYREKDGLPNDVVCGILPDEEGCLWLSTIKGISKFDPIKKTFKNYSPADGLQSNEFNVTSCYKSRSGEMFFGGVNGFNSFFPGQITDNKHIPPIVITDFHIFNRPVAIGGNSPLKKHITETKQITLSYRQNVFSFNFVALDYSIPEKNQYTYKMVGFDKDWVSTPSSRRFVSYTNLDPGEYTFRVKGSNNDGVWNKKGVFVNICITPPYWRTWWFQSIMVMLVLVLLVFIHKIRLRMTSQKMRLEMELQTARTAQMSIMPQTDPQLEGFQVSGICEPAHEVGGDFFDYFWLNPEETKFGIAIGDVSGKAMKAAMNAILSSGMLYSTIHHAATIKEIMSEVNGPLFSKTDKRMFTALCLASLDLQTQEFVFTNAGLSEPLLKSQGSAAFIKSLGSRLPLGGFQNSDYRETTLQLKSSDVVVLYTDGVSEARNQAGEFYGCDKLKTLVEKMDTTALSAAEIKERIITDVKQFAGDIPQHDDITVVVIKFQG